jgi:hypothetical protein
VKRQKRWKQQREETSLCTTFDYMDAQEGNGIDHRIITSFWFAYPYSYTELGYQHQVGKEKLRLCLDDGLFGLATPSWPTSLESSDGWTQLDVIIQTEDISLTYRWNEDH